MRLPACRWSSPASGKGLLPWGPNHPKTLVSLSLQALGAEAKAVGARSSPGVRGQWSRWCAGRELETTEAAGEIGPGRQISERLGVVGWGPGGVWSCLQSPFFFCPEWSPCTHMKPGRSCRRGHWRGSQVRVETPP